MDQIFNLNDAPFYAEIRRYCFRMINSETEADDLVQEVYVRLCKSERDLKGSHLRNWLFRVARNLVIDRRRSKRPVNVVPDEDGASVFDAPDDKSVNPATEVEHQEKIQIALSLLNNCDDRTREIFRLRFHEGYSFSAIGMKVGLSTTSVRNIINGKLGEFLEAFRKLGAVN